MVGGGVVEAGDLRLARPGRPSSVNRLEEMLKTMRSDEDTRTDVTHRLRSTLSSWLGTQEAAEAGSADFALQSASPDEVFSYLDRELGLS